MLNATVTQQLRMDIENIFTQHPHLPLRNVHVQTTQTGVVSLSGRVKSFYEKQMAQEAIRNLQGIQNLQNELTVSD
jgi:osmotically-inducible protein OsmY